MGLIISYVSHIRDSPNKRTFQPGTEVDSQELSSEAPMPPGPPGPNLEINAVMAGKMMCVSEYTGCQFVVGGHLFVF